jgi:hypothetical protein
MEQICLGVAQRLGAAMELKRVASFLVGLKSRLSKIVLALSHPDADSASK